jgi:hypothetical protein
LGKLPVNWPNPKALGWMILDFLGNLGVATTGGAK